MQLLILAACHGDPLPAVTVPPAPTVPVNPPVPEPEPDPEPELAPTLEAVDPTLLPVPTSTGLPPISGFSVNVRIHPHALPTRWSVAYGDDLTTPERTLPGRLDAHYSEDWATG